MSKPIASQIFFQRLTQMAVAFIDKAGGTEEQMNQATRDTLRDSELCFFIVGGITPGITNSSAIDWGFLKGQKIVENMGRTGVLEPGLAWAAIPCKLWRMRSN